MSTSTKARETVSLNLPWTLTYHFHGPRPATLHVLNCHGDIVATINRNGNQKVQEAIGNLMVHSPELYAANLGLDTALQSHVDTEAARLAVVGIKVQPGEVCPCANDELAKARAVVEKVKGEFGTQPEVAKL